VMGLGLGLGLALTKPPQENFRSSQHLYMY
jgi:hypothetical protein